MRVAEDEINFSSYLLKNGDGTVQVHPSTGQDMTQIAQEYLVHTFDELVDKVFPNIHEGFCWVTKRAILTPWNGRDDFLAKERHICL